MTLYNDDDDDDNDDALRGIDKVNAPACYAGGPKGVIIVVIIVIIV